MIRCNCIWFHPDSITNHSVIHIVLTCSLKAPWLQITKLIWQGWICASSPLHQVPQELIRCIIQFIPSIFDEPDSHHNITILDERPTGIPKVHTITLFKLVEKCTEPSPSRFGRYCILSVLTCLASHYQHELLYTYPSFTTTSYLLDLLTERLLCANSTNYKGIEKQYVNSSRFFIYTKGAAILSWMGQRICTRIYNRWNRHQGEGISTLQNKLLENAWTSN